MSDREFIPAEEELGDRRKRFVAEFMRDMTASAAAQRAGYTGDGAGARPMKFYFL